MRAVAVVTQHFQDLGYTVEDVGATESYDLDVRRGGEHLYVEVKGTTSSGQAVVLTKNEVRLHREKYPDNALAVVRHIRFEASEHPVCSGGELALFQPWEIDDDALTKSVRGLAEKADFKPERPVIEIRGLCAQCH